MGVVRRFVLPVVLGLGAMGVVHLLDGHRYGTVLDSSASNEVLYHGGATAEHAETFQARLESVGYYDELDGSTVRVSGNPPEAVAFVLQDGAWEEEGTVEYFEGIGALVAGEFGLPLRVDLCDVNMEAMRSVDVTRTADDLLGALYGDYFDDGDGNLVFYTDGATVEDAGLVHDQMVRAGYFTAESEGVVRIAGAETPREFSIVLSDGAWTNEATVAWLRTLAELVGFVHGFPVELKLCNLEFVPQREFQVEAPQL